MKDIFWQVCGGLLVIGGLTALLFERALEDYFSYHPYNKRRHHGRSNGTDR